MSQREVGGPMNRLILFTLFLTACSSNPHKAEKIDTKVDLSQMVATDQVIGVKDGNMIVQKKVMMGEELRRLQNEAYELEAKVYGGPRYLDNEGLWGAVRKCYIEAADSRNGGDGKLRPMSERREYVIPENDGTKIGLDEKDEIVGISEEFLKDRIDRYQTYRTVLRQREDEYTEKLQVCQLSLRHSSPQAVQNEN